MTSAVLIADSHEARGRRLVEACAERGFTARRAETGAQALEMTLSEVPDLVVAASDLALIDARRLAEILRANPRTQQIRFVLVGRDATGGQASGLFDEVLPPEGHGREAARRIEAMLAHRDRIDEVGKQTAADHEVQGQLSQIPLTDLLQVFHMNRRTGHLELTRGEAGRRRERGEVLVRDGNVVQAHAGPGVEGEKALYRLLAWREGSFAFAPTKVNAAARILTPTRALLLEGVRQLDEWDRLRASLPPRGARVLLAVPKAELPNAVHPVTQEVLLLLEIYDRVRDVVDHCSYPDYQVLRTLQTLVDRGLVELRRDAVRSDLEARGSLFDAAQVRRFRDWVEADRPRGSLGTPAKLLVASADTAATRDFVRLLGDLPGMDVHPGFEDGRFRPDDLAEIGVLTVGDGLGIAILHVPMDPAFEAVWPIAVHGALGTLVLLSQPVEEAEGRLEPFLQVLSRRTGVRLFHTLLLRKGERISPEQMHEKLGWLDSSSLFLLQVESDRDPVQLLRTMMARVLP